MAKLGESVPQEVYNWQACSWWLLRPCTQKLNGNYLNISCREEANQQWNFPSPIANHNCTLYVFQVNAIFVNIFGGIIRCDEIAKGIIAAAQESNLTTPIVVRLQGNYIN